MPIVYIHTYIHTYISLFAAAATRTQNESHRQYMETPLRHGVLLHGSSRYSKERCFTFIIHQEIDAYVYTIW